MPAAVASSSTFHGIVLPMLYLLSAVLFILGLKGLTKVRSARRGNGLAALAMLIAIVATLLEMGRVDYRWILSGLVVGGLIGAIAATRVEMTSMPELVALFNGFGGGSSMLVALAILWKQVIEPGARIVDGDAASAASVLGGASVVTAVLSVLIGAVTLTGSGVAFLKLGGKISGQPTLIPGRHPINLALLVGSIGLGLYAGFASGSPLLWIVATALSLLLGVLLVIPIGGADMPVIISLLNSLSGVAAAATGFVLSNNLLIISGALVGASGLILTQVMCKAMNRTLGNVLFGGFGAQPQATGGGGSDEYTNVRSYSAEDVALILENAESVIIVPGYGLAVAQAQHTAKELGTLLEANGAKVTYAIHPVAGRMPGHMNVLLAEADVPYEQLIEMDRINPEFKTTDAVLVVGANDVVNPAAENSPGSPIHGMPILQVHHAQTVIVVKRSLSPGFAGIKNELFEYDNTMMVFEDAKAALQQMIGEVKELAS